MAVIEAIGVRKTYQAGHVQVEAVRGIDLHVERSTLLAVTGPSGSGKSSFLYLLGGLEVPTAGRVLLEGTDLAALDDDQRTLLRRRRIGFIFQSFNLLPMLTAEENVGLPLKLERLSRAETSARARAMLAIVGMEHRRKHFPSELSGGEQQRVAIARALVIQPAILLADEPTGNLDSENGLQVTAVLRQLVEQQQQTIVMVTHDLSLASVADRVILVRDGRVQEAAPPKTHPSALLAPDL
jgi:putative ABC transport system ATP-binding protein